MNLLKHPNVRVACQFARGTFSFLPPDHWSNTRRAGTAKRQVLVIEIANDAGREVYHTGSDRDLEDAGRTFGAKPVNIVRPASEDASRGIFSPPDALFCKAKAHVPTERAVCTHDFPPDKIELPEHACYRFPKGERVFTDGSLNDSGGIGAAYYDESTDSTTKITVGMGEGILRAELTAILKIIQDKQGADSVLRVFTDSLLSIRLIRRWMYFSHELGHTDNMDMLDSIGQALADRGGRTELYKVRAHIGVEGNEKADTGAKEVAQGKVESEDLTEVDMTHTTAGRWTRKLFQENGSRVEKVKQQLKGAITNWLALHRGYKYTAAHMWQCTEAQGLDVAASTAWMWDTGTHRGIHRVQEVLKARFLELMPGKGTGETTSDTTGARENVCEICNEKGNWYHITSMCKHPDIKDFYTVRHNAAGTRLVQGIRQGKMGRWLTLTGFGKVDDLGEDATVPNWMLSKKEKEAVRETIVTSGDIQLRGGIQPDIVILEGWPETELPPRGPAKFWKSNSGEKFAVKLVIAELGFTSDMCSSSTVSRKRDKYGPLVAALRNAGWDVAPLTHVITVGARATVPTRNADVLKELGIVKAADQKTMQRTLAYTAAIHLNMIVWQYRKLCRTRHNNINNNISKTGVG